MREFATINQLSKYLMNIAEVFDDCYNTTYHKFDMSIDINSLIDMQHQMKADKANYDYYKTIGIRETGVESGSSIDNWGDRILCKLQFGYNASTKKYYCTTL